MTNGISGAGSNTFIEYNPFSEFAVKNDPTSKPPAVYRGIHELIHTLHGMTGTRDLTLINEINPHTGKQMTREGFNTRTHENRIRKERGVKPRPVTLKDIQTK
jgi:hypothetical protein